MPSPPVTVTRSLLEGLYERLNRRELVHPDPLELVYPYDDVRDREIAGLVASALAYGRAAQIQRAVGPLLALMGSPRAFVERSSASALRRAFAGFRHRWSTGDEVAALLLAAKGVVARHGSLGASLESSIRPGDEDVVAAEGRLVDELAAEGRGRCGSLLAHPCRGSACKRLHLWLRWMVRRDAVDPGGWVGVPRALLVVPLDTHMRRIARGLGLTRRSAADLATAREVTRAFGRFSPEDPVRYDFALTRLGIRGDLDLDALFGPGLDNRVRTMFDGGRPWTTHRS